MAPTLTPLKGLGTSSSAETSLESTFDVATVSVMERLPQFWMDSPRLWFTQFEAILAPQKQGDDYKFNAVVAKIPKEVVHQVSDLLTSPPENNKYGILKERLIQCYEESEHRRFHKLLSEMNLGDQKPSQLLRKMREAGAGKINEDTIRLLWIRQLPTAVTTVLAVTEQLPLERLSEVADRIFENISCHKDVLPTQRSASVDIDLVTQLTSQLAAANLQIAALQNNRSRQMQRRSNSSRQRYRRPRSSSRQHSSQRNRFDLCYYHRRFRERANKCESPCSWTNRSETSENLN